MEDNDLCSFDMALFRGELKVTPMTKRETIKKAKELCAEFSKRSEWPEEFGGLSKKEIEQWRNLIALIHYVEKNRKSP